MVHGIVLGGAALMALSAALFSMLAARTTVRTGLVADDQPRALGALTTFIAVILWLTVLTGTYVVFPAYRATPPAGVTDLSAYPRALVLANPDTAWLHAFAMESKEHVPWIAAMLATAVAFVSVRYRSRVRSDGRMRKLAVTLLAICMALVIFIGLMGVFVNKVAPLE
jgi:hypothetical protein